MRVLLSGIQWMIFMVAGAIAAPIAIADLYELTANETAILMQSTLFVLGIAGFLQGIFGHKMPIHEGPAGLWWSVFTVYAGLVGVLYTSSNEALQALSGGMLVSGVLFILLAGFRLIDKIALLFTPTITFIYLFLLIMQLSGTFMKGMLGITSASGEIDVSTSLLSITVVGITYWFGNHHNEYIKRFSIMLSIFIGWILFLLFGKAPTIKMNENFMLFPEIWPYGPPSFDGGTILMACFLTFLLITNVVASIRLMETVLSKSNQQDSSMFNRSGYTAGVNQLISSGMSSIASVPISGAAGFVQQTKIKNQSAFIVGCLLVMILSLFPSVVNIVAAIPAPIGYAVTFVIFTKMIGLAFKELKKVMHEEKTYVVCGIAIMVGVGLMFIPATATINLPPLLIVFINNGLVIGCLLAIIVEQIISHRNSTSS